MDEGIIKPKICSSEELDDDIREALDVSPEHICIREDRIYLAFGQTVFSFPNDPAVKALAYSLNQKQNKHIFKPRNKGELFEKILNDPNYIPDTTLLKTLDIRQNGLRRIAVFRSMSPLDKDLYSIISSMAPTENGDAVIPADYQTVVFVKDTQGQSAEETEEFIEALIGTMEDEGVGDIHAGIGRECKELTELRASYLEGLHSIDLGLRYRHQDHVFVYEKQMIERIVDLIPQEKKSDILQMFFKDASEDLFSDEIQTTVRVFFQNDLNLTAASKQLFIHRNTLNYRLDKIKKDFGLDLRSFQDAVVFRIISEIANET